MKLTFLLCTLLGVITAAAVTYGYMKPPEKVTAPAKNIPITERAENIFNGNEQSSAETPRFVYDEPLSEQPVTPTEPSSAASSVKPAESEIAILSPSEAEQPVVIETPTEEQIAEISAEHFRELDALIDRITSSLDQLAQQALTDYRMLPNPEDRIQLSVLAAKYLPSVYKLEADADSEAEIIFENLGAALEEIGADDTPVAEAKVKYEAAKAAQLDFYKELAGTITVE